MYLNNKLGKHQAMSKEKELARHLPQTAPADRKRVREMLERHRAVYLKPSHGTGGYGIYKLSRTLDGYLLQNGTQSRRFKSFDHAYEAFEKSRGRRLYLVQQGIPLLRHHGRPFDLRVMVQRNPQSKWEVTGIVGRVAQPNKVVTNYHNGGQPKPVEELLAPLMSQAEIRRYIHRLHRLGIRVSSHLSGIFPRFRAYGIDIGLDTDLKPWIIEVNTRPDKYIFNALKDQRMFRKMIRYENKVLPKKKVIKK
ncbi:YheC/YheD family protein [Paenibacillus sp. YPG26]|uniref:YheC/YheD family protein n=1 Tax=Paenibacillus sp. YPG26 TaxID=2878915 RepID=UPI00203BE023|nr:YheC/YheD family protein [Paenibacillus sp. YPG26]USB32682.1 YheC/YheD family protein [Paenibacillus sp. YPG26]